MKRYVFTEQEVAKILETLASQPYRHSFAAIEMIKKYAQELPEAPPPLVKKRSSISAAKKRIEKEIGGVK